MNYLSDRFSISLKWFSFYIRAGWFVFDIGWYSGNPFYLLQFNLLEVYEYKDGANLIYVQFLKFVIGISISGWND